jgi:hypothetical protein
VVEVEVVVVVDDEAEEEESDDDDAAAGATSGLVSHSSVDVEKEATFLSQGEGGGA